MIYYLLIIDFAFNYYIEFTYNPINSLPWKLQTSVVVTVEVISLSVPDEQLYLFRYIIQL